RSRDRTVPQPDNDPAAIARYTGALFQPGGTMAITARIVRAHKTGGPEVMQIDEVQLPSPGAGQALVRIEAAGVNFIDIYQRSGQYPLPMPLAMGVEGAGVVEQVGPGVTEVRVGQRVAWWTNVGGTVGSEEKAQLARKAGAEEVIVYTRTDFEPEVKRLTGGAGASVVYDSVGKDTFDRGLKCLRRRGMMVLFGQSSGAVPPFDLQRLAAGGSLYVTRPTVGSYITTRDELLSRAGAVLEMVRRRELEVKIDS